MIAQMERGSTDVRTRASGQPSRQSLLRRMGQAPHRLATLGRRTGRQLRAETFIGKPGRQIVSRRGSALDPEVIITAWCGAGGSRAVGENHRRPWLAWDCPPY